MNFEIKRAKSATMWLTCALSCLLLLGASLNAQETILWSTDFESDNSGFTHSGGVDEWEWGTPVFGTNVVPHSGTNVWGTDLDGRVDFYHDGNLYGPPILLPAISATEKLYVSFWGLIKVDGMSDRGTFYVSGDGSSWNELADLLYTMDIGYDSEGNPAEYNGVVGWKKYVFDVSNYAGGNLHIRFQCIKYGNDSWYGSPVHDMAGFYIDDIAVTLIDGVDHFVQFDLEGWEDSNPGASCPWVMTWDGEGYDKTNDIYSTARLPLNEFTDYLMLDNGIVPDGDVYRMKISELDEEVSYTDHAFLRIIDYPDGVEIGCDDKGNIATYGYPSGPLTAVDQDGNDVVGLITTTDGSGFHGFNESYIDLEFDNVPVDGPAKLVIKSTGFLADFNYDGNLTAFSKKPGIYIQTQDASGGWIDRGYFNPRFKPSTMVFDLAEFVPSALGQSEVRLYVVSCNNNKYHLLDFVGLDTSADIAVGISDLYPISAVHSASGDVMSGLAGSDDDYVVTEFGQEIALEFANPAQEFANRAFVFVSEGYYVEGPNTFFIFTWDGSDWVLRDAKSYQTPSYVDYTHSFDLSLFLPDPDGEYKVRIWQDYKYNNAAIDFVSMAVDGISGDLASAYNWEVSPYASECLSLLSASDNSRLDFVAYSISIRGRTRIVDVEFTGLPVCLGVPQASNIDVGGAEDIYNITSPNPPIEWDFYDVGGDLQTEFAVQVWTNAGGSGTNLWTYAEASSATSVSYGGDPLEPGNSYFVRVRVRDDESASCWSAWEETIFRTYCEDCEPPVIVRTDPTIGLSSSSQTAGNELIIEAHITDNVSVESAVLFFRTTGVSDFTSVAMTYISGDLYRGVVPASVVLTPGVDYYLWASDGVSSTTDPFTNPAANPYQIPVVPNVAPEVIHTPIVSAPCGSNISVSAQVLDYTDYVSAVKLHYRMAGDFIYQIATMSGYGGSYGGTIPSAYTMGTSVEYFISAMDNHGVYTYSGLFDAPHSIALEGICDNPPEVIAIESTPCGEDECDPTFTWTYFDSDGNPQSEFEVEVWSGAGGTGARLWNPPVIFGDDNTIDYDGLPIQEGNCYYFRIKVRDGILWSEWAEHEFCFNTSSSIAGVVFSNGAMLHGVYIDLFDDGATLLASAVTDESGYYEFEEVARGTYSVEIQIPLGYAPVSEPCVAVELDRMPAEVNFELEPTAEGSSFSWSHWWWKIAVDKIGQGIVPPWGSRVEIEDALQAAFDHFYDRSDGYGIQIPEVTCIGDPGRAMTFDDLHGIFFPAVYDGSYPAKARRSLMTHVLNLASGHMLQTHIVSDDGATASQALTYFAGLYLTGGDAAIYSTYYYMKKIWKGQQVPAGIIPLSTPNIMYKPDSGEAGPDMLPAAFVLHQNYPNPFNPVTEIKFDLPVFSDVRVEIFNIAGQKVTTLASGPMGPGMHTVSWDASEFASGMYMYRLTVNNFVDTKKMVLLK